MYCNHNCRCEPCTEANRDYTRAYWRRWQFTPAGQANRARRAKALKRQSET